MCCAAPTACEHFKYCKILTKPESCAILNGLFARERAQCHLVLYEIQGGDMASKGSQVTNSNLRPTRSGSSHVELNERLANTVNELYQLLELYAPAWYTEELHEKAESALRTMGKLSIPRITPQPRQGLVETSTFGSRQMLPGLYSSPRLFL